MSQDDLVSLGITAVHVGIAAALWFGLPGARLATLVAFAVHWLHFGYVWLIALFVVLSGPGLGSGGVNPVLLGALAAVAVGVALISMERPSDQCSCRTESAIPERACGREVIAA